MRRRGDVRWRLCYRRRCGCRTPLQRTDAAARRASALLPAWVSNSQVFPESTHPDARLSRRGRVDAVTGRMIPCLGRKRHGPRASWQPLLLLLLPSLPRPSLPEYRDQCVRQVVQSEVVKMAAARDGRMTAAVEEVPEEDSCSKVGVDGRRSQATADHI